MTTIHLGRTQKSVLVVVALVGLLTWATWPAEGQLDGATCSPNGLFAKLSAVLHGDAFWRVQLAGLAHSREIAENWDNSQADLEARTRAIVDQSKSSLNRISEAYPSLAPTEAHVAAQRLRDLADRIEIDEAKRVVSESMRRSATVLKACEETIATRLH
jgi:hypothetical protein